MRPERIDSVLVTEGVFDPVTPVSTTGKDSRPGSNAIQIMRAPTTKSPPQ
jgi:hypothetical protein